jgi:hypothetical protein
VNEEIRALLVKHRVPGREVACPYCRAFPERPCTSNTGGALQNLHASRYEAAGLPTALIRREPA